MRAGACGFACLDMEGGNSGYWRVRNIGADRGYAYVGVEQTQNELEVRLFSGDERHRGG
jgi:hypothetical protein